MIYFIIIVICADVVGMGIMFCVQASSLVSNEEEAKAALQISNKLAEALLKYHRQKEPQRQQVGADSHVNFQIFCHVF